MRYTNTFFNLGDFLYLIPDLVALIFFHPQMAKKILNPKYLGIKGWEYASLLSAGTFKPGMNILDVGSGGSLTPYFLASKKRVNVTTLDLKDPSEKPKFSLIDSRVTSITGSMLHLPFKDKTFDLTLCLSAIEHLDEGNYSMFLRNTKKALSEIVRVTKSKGFIFMTSDIYYPQFQKTDKWDGAKGKTVGTAYKKEDFERIFIKTFTQLGCEPVCDTDFHFDKLRSNFFRSIYRGRYFTTFRLYVQKKN